jgi:hypothetical protein
MAKTKQTPEVAPEITIQALKKEIKKLESQYITLKRESQKLFDDKCNELRFSELKFKAVERISKGISDDYNKLVNRNLWQRIFNIR